MTSRHKLSNISQQSNQQQLTAGQKKFNALMKKIEAKRLLLQQWMDIYPDCQQLWTTDLLPLLTEQAQCDLERLRQLHKASGQYKFSKKDRETLSDIICVMVASFMGGQHDEELKRIYFEHTGVDFDAERREEDDFFKMSLEETFGVDLGDDIDLSSTEEVTQRLHEKLTEEAEKAKSSAKPRKKSASEQRREQEQAESTQSVREIYRKLASALHPDRATDPDEHERKTGMMQRVNQAYADNNLLALLQIQMEIEQIDQQHINNLPEKRLKHFNRILTEQLQELEDEIFDQEMRLKEQFLMEPYENIKPGTITRKCKKTIQDVSTVLDRMQYELQAWGDPKKLKLWLKEQRALEKAEMDMWLDDLYEAEDFYR